MKTCVNLLSMLLITALPVLVEGQITTAQIKANFGVDAELRANYFEKSSLNGNDDWFSLSAAGALGKGIIDTTGAADIVNRYATDVNSRRLPFYRTMSYPAYSVVNNRLLIDAVFIRDYHGEDSTVFAGGNKNGSSPQKWVTPVSQSIPDKNEILDMMVHVRRQGPNKTDSLWMIGGLSIENTSGNRYFDFEMYQTDIYYDRSTLKFYNYGPDAGHTSWAFNSAGEVTTPGDIIFTAEYSSSELSNLEARIWVHKSALNITPAGFLWGGSFEGESNSSDYGYANIKPLTVGAFYSGLQNGGKTWAGAFKLVLGTNTVVDDYSRGQFMEFSVNLTKLGLDPVTLLGGSECGMPFRRVLVKTRSAVSFSSELKDFVGPFDFFLPERSTAAATVPVFCAGSDGVSEINVLDPSPTSIYTWTTSDGNIVGTSTGPDITVDTPGTYIVSQQLQAGCSTYSQDTVTVVADPLCALLNDGSNKNQGKMNSHVAIRPGIRIQPNPVNEHSQLVINVGYNGKVFIRMIDMSGRIRSNRTASVLRGSNMLKLNQQGQLSRGIYYVQVLDQHMQALGAQRFVVP